MALTSAENYIWDSWFIENGKELHAFYLQASKNECKNNPDNRHNLAVIGHSIKVDSHWVNAEPSVALRNSPSTSWDDLSLWTGSTIFCEEDSLYYMFYTSRSYSTDRVQTPRELQRPQNIGLALSKDLMTWDKHPNSINAPIIPVPQANSCFDGVNWRDPYAFKNHDDKYYVFLTARSGSSAKDQGGIITYFKSSKIDQWNPSDSHCLVESKDFYQLEVPQVFWKSFGNKKRFYVLFSALDLDCSELRKSELPAEECLTGTYYMFSDELPQDFNEIPNNFNRARLLASKYYSGKILCNSQNNNFNLWGFINSSNSNDFISGIADPLGIEFCANGQIKVKNG